MKSADNVNKKLEIRSKDQIFEDIFCSKHGQQYKNLIISDHRPGEENSVIAIFAAAVGYRHRRHGNDVKLKELEKVTIS